MENTPDKLKIDNQFLTTDEINKIIPEALIGDAFHIKVSKQTAEYLIANDIVNDIMNAEYGNDGFYGEQWTGMTKDDFNDETQKFDDDYQTFEIDVNPITRIGLEKKRMINRQWLPGQGSEKCAIVPEELFNKVVKYYQEMCAMAEKIRDREL